MSGWPLQVVGISFHTGPMDLCIITRHAESAYNVAGLTNGDPSVSVELTDRGTRQALRLAEDLPVLERGVCIHTRFNRTLETARLALGGQTTVPLICEPLLDDIACGSFEGGSVAGDHAWRGRQPRSRAPVGGESIRTAALRIARGLRVVAERPEPRVVVVSHDLVVRYALNAAAGATDISAPMREAPQAMIFTLDRESLLGAAERIHEAASGVWGRAVPGGEANGG